MRPFVLILKLGLVTLRFNTIFIMPFSIELFSVSFTPWYLAAWNALAVDQYVNKPEENAKKNPAAADNDTAEPTDVKSLEEQTETIEE